MKNVSTSTKIYFALILLLVLVKLFFLIAPVKFPLSDQAGAFSWLTILTVTVLGFIGLLLSRRTGFPDIWDTHVSNRQRFLIPLVVGLVYGVVTVAEQAFRPSGHPLAQGSVHVKLPLSFPFYIYGATFLEIFLRLFIIPFVIWLISNLILRGRWQTLIFWLAAILAALYEPLPFMTEEFGSAGILGALKILIGSLFVANIVAAYLFRKYGFLAPLVMRLSFYLVWHVIYGGLIA